MSILAIGVVMDGRADFRKEVGIWIQADTNTMDEQDRESSSRSVGPVPVREVLGRRTEACYEADRAEGKEHEEAGKREAVEVEA